MACLPWTKYINKINGNLGKTYFKTWLLLKLPQLCSLIEKVIGRFVPGPKRKTITTKQPDFTTISKEKITMQCLIPHAHTGLKMKFYLDAKKFETCAIFLN